MLCRVYHPYISVQRADAKTLYMFSWAELMGSPHNIIRPRLEAAQTILDSHLVPPADADVE